MSAMPLDSRDKAENKARLPGLSLMALIERHEVATFYVTSRLHEEIVVFDNFYLSHKSEHASFSANTFVT